MNGGKKKDMSCASAVTAMKFQVPIPRVLISVKCFRINKYYEH